VDHHRLGRPAQQQDGRQEPDDAQSLGHGIALPFPHRLGVDDPRPRGHPASGAASLVVGSSP
jgi:hypothetical protein